MMGSTVKDFGIVLRKFCNIKCKSQFNNGIYKHFSNKVFNLEEFDLRKVSSRKYIKYVPLYHLQTNLQPVSFIFLALKTTYRMLQFYNLQTWLQLKLILIFYNTSKTEKSCKLIWCFNQ